MLSENRFTSYVRQLNWSDIGAKAIMALAGLCLLGAILSTAYLLFNPGLLDKLSTVMSHNMNFWLIAISGISYGLWRKFRNPQEFTWIELPFQIFISLIVTIGCFGSFLFWSSGLQDFEIWNGSVSKAEYYEEWTEEVTYTEQQCTGTGNSTSCTSVLRTRHDYHPPEWKIITSNGEVISISSSNYRQYVSQFGNEKEEDLTRINQVSFGDGDKYVTKWQGNLEAMVPTAVPHQYVNYLKASKSLQRRSGTTSAYVDYLIQYPNVEEGEFGKIEISRVLVSETNVSQNWINTVDKQLDQSLASLGAEKQVNLLVYVVGTTDRGFLHALEEDWTYGKKNDVVLVLGTNDFPNVEWAGVMIFHGNEELRVKLRDAIETQANVSDPQAFVSLFVNHIENYFKRVPMDELEHLLHDIEMPWWAILLVWIMVGTVVFVTSQVIENNQTRKYGFYRS